MLKVYAWGRGVATAIRKFGKISLANLETDKVGDNSNCVEGPHSYTFTRVRD